MIQMGDTRHLANATYNVGTATRDGVRKSLPGPGPAYADFESVRHTRASCLISLASATPAEFNRTATATTGPVTVAMTRSSYMRRIHGNTTRPLSSSLILRSARRQSQPERRYVGSFL